VEKENYVGREDGIFVHSENSLNELTATGALVATGSLQSCMCMWRAPYIHEFLTLKLGGILSPLLKGGREIMATYRCKNPPTIEE
jgi:hypothetical protein